MAFTVFLAGCSSYQAASFDIAPAGDLVITNKYDTVVNERDLLGKHLEVRMLDGTVVTGKVVKVTATTLIFGADGYVDSQFEGALRVGKSIAKSDIAEVRTREPHNGKSVFGLFAFGMLTIVVIVLRSGLGQPIGN